MALILDRHFSTTEPNYNTLQYILIVPSETNVMTKIIALSF